MKTCFFVDKPKFVFTHIKLHIPTGLTLEVHLFNVFLSNGVARYMIFQFSLKN